MKNGESIIKRTVRKIGTFVKWLLSIIYFSATSMVNIFAFVHTFNLEGSFLYAIAATGISLVIMDIVCSIVEDIASTVYKFGMKIQEKKKRKKQESENKKQSKIEQLEDLIKERDDFISQIEEMYENCTSFKENIQFCTELPRDTKKELISLCERVENILRILEQNTEKYYPIRHTFKVVFPKFQKSTYTFMDIAKADNLDKETEDGFGKLIEEFNKQLDYVKATISSADKLNLNVEIESLVRTMQTERKNGDI